MRARARSAALLTAVLLFLPSSRPVLAQSPQEMFDEGRKALRANDFKLAETIFAELLKKDPSAANYGYLAVAELSAGDPAQAIAHFEQSHRLGNDSATLHYQWGLAYLQRRDENSAARELRTALSKDPKLFQADTALGIALVNAGRPKEAVTYLERARTHFPKDADSAGNSIPPTFSAGHDDSDANRHCT